MDKEKDKELRLIKKGKKGLLGLIFSRTGIVLLLLILAALSLFSVFTWFAEGIVQVMGGVGLFNLIVIIAIVNSRMDATSKLTWILIISITSVFGAIFFLYIRFDIGSRAVKAGYSHLIQEHRYDLAQDPEVIQELHEISPETQHLHSYLNRSTSVIATRYNKVKYYPLGEQKWEDMLKELKKAEKFIFMEYFIVEEGTMWGRILQILREKAEAGVDVRVMYDGTCAMSTLPYNYPKMLEKYGIKCKMFSPLRPFVSTHYNYRDHRKILVIDGKTGFSGGVNLADEYINKRKRFGHWKDTAIQIKGEGVKNLTLLFLNMWSFGETEPEYEKFLNVPCDSYEKEKGFVFSYGSNPFEKDRVGERVYVDMLNRANKYVHIMTPYLILDDELLQALKYAAERGVDVKIMMPGIPDKKAVYTLAKTFFDTLIESGVKIYLYDPGFLHAKVFVSDDKKAVVGTINLDYRSLYHHFECGTYLYETECIEDIEKDYQETLKKCSAVKLGDYGKQGVFSRVQGRVMRLIAPLL